MQLPEQDQQQAQAGQRTPSALQQAVDRAITEELIAGYRDTTPLPLVGTTPPVAQPGQPPMSQWATDASGILRGVAVASLPVGTALWIVGQIDPLTLGIIFGCPVAALLAVGRLVGKVKATVEAAPATHHHHYTGTVVQDSRSISTTTRGVIANTRNQTR